MKSLNCPNRECRRSGRTIVGNIIRFGFYNTRRGKRRRFRCRACEKTFCSNTATPRLQSAVQSTAGFLLRDISLQDDSNIHSGISRALVSLVSSTRARNNRRPFFSTVSAMNTIRSHHGCHRYCTVRISLMWVFGRRFVSQKPSSSVLG